jgi:hypothetical protein
MSSSEKIQAWFDNGCDYQEGIRLYEQSLHNRNLLRIFKVMQSEQNHKLLKNELQNLLPRKVVKKPVQVIKKVAQKTVEVTQQDAPKKLVLEQIYEHPEYKRKQQIFFHSLPPELRPVYEEATRIYRENCRLKVELNELPEEARHSALQLQLKIHANFETNHILWSKIQYWLDYRVIPKDKKSPIDNLTPAQLLRRVSLLEASISKYNKELVKNRELHDTASTLEDRKRILRKIVRQEAALISKSEELNQVKNRINGK